MRIVVGKFVQRERGNRQGLARGDEQRGACRRLEERDLRVVGEVVQDDEGTLVVQLVAVEGRELAWIVGKLGIETDEGADDVGEGVGGSAGRVGGAAHFDQDLRVGIVVSEVVGDDEGKFGLTDPAHAANAGDGNRTAGEEHLLELLNLRVAAGEVLIRRAEGVARGEGRGRGGRLSGLLLQLAPEVRRDLAREVFG